jgi:anti-sigma factor RsiW
VRGEETHALLFAYLDQELEVVSHMGMADHLATCPQCTRAYTAQQAVQSALLTAHALLHRRCFWQALRKVPCSALPWAPTPSPPWRVLLLRTERPSSATAATRPAGRHHSGPHVAVTGSAGGTRGRLDRAQHLGQEGHELL